jgi:hypothetical protein
MQSALSDGRSRKATFRPMVTGRSRSLRVTRPCILNVADVDAHVEITIYYSDREPAGPCRLTVFARRSHHVRFNDLTDPEPIHVDTDFASIIESDVPTVVQHTRLDSRQAVT